MYSPSFVFFLQSHDVLLVLFSAAIQPCRAYIVLYFNVALFSGGWGLEVPVTSLVASHRRALGRRAPTHRVVVESSLWKVAVSSGHKMERASAGLNGPVDFNVFIPKRARRSRPVWMALERRVQGRRSGVGPSQQARRFVSEETVRGRTAGLDGSVEHSLSWRNR